MRKKIFSPFVKGLAENFQPLRAKRAAKANINEHKPKLVASSFGNLPHNNTTHKTRECESKCTP
ncbi:MAG: hypothetical protein ACI4J7_10635 [Ruminiclostridium sp.]